MPKKLKPRTDFEKTKTISAFYSGGKVGLLDNSRFLVCPYKDSLNIIDTQSGMKIACAKLDDDDEISSFCFTDSVLVTISKSMLVKKWSLKEVFDIGDEKDVSEEIKLDCERTWKAVHKSPVTSCEIDSSGTLLATGSADWTTKIYDLSRQYHTHNIKNSGIIRVIKFWVYGGVYLVVTADDNGQIQITHLQTKRCVFSVNAHFGAVLDLKFDSQQNWFVSIGRDCLAFVWTPGKLDDGFRTTELQMDQSSFTLNEVAEAVIVPNIKQVGHLPIDVESNSKIFITAGARGVFKVWDSTGRCLQAFGKLSSQNTEDDSSLAPIFSMNQQDGTFIASSYTNDLFLYNLETLKIVKMFSGDPEEISSTCFVGNDKALLAVASKSKFLKLLNINTSHVQITCAHTDVIISVCSSTDGNFVATTSKDKTVKLWIFNSDKQSLKCIGSMVGHTMDVLDAQFFVNDNQSLCSVSEDLTLKVWKLKTEDTDQIRSLKCAWTVKAHDKQINCCKVSPNDELIVTGSHDKLIKAWFVKSQTLSTVLTGHRKGIWAIDFSKHEQIVVSASGDTTVKLWNLANSTCMATFEGHDCAVIQVSLFNKSSQIVSSATSGLVKVWDVKTSECITTLDGHNDKVWSLSVMEKQSSSNEVETKTENAPEELVIVSAGADASIVSWKDVTSENKLKKFEEQNEILTQMQAMENLLLGENYLEAIKLAIKLNQPYKLLTILEKILSKKEVAAKLSAIVSDLPEADLVQLLKFCVIWNSNSKNCHSAQILMEIVFKSWSPESLIELPGVAEMIEQLLCYQERHLDRLEKLQRDATLLDFTSFCIKETAET